MIIIYVLASVFIVSLVSFVGLFFLSLRSEMLNKLTLFLISFSAGTMLGGALIHLLPESVEKFGSSKTVWFGVLAGLLVFFVLEKIVCWRHCHIPTSNKHPHHLGVMNLVGDGLHNFIDGVVIAGTFMIDAHLGFVTTMAVVVHEIPQEIGDFGVLIYAGYSRKKALILNFSIALMAMGGALITLLIGPKIGQLADFILPFTAGGFIYIATADLIPELKKEPGIQQSIKQLLGIILGITLMLLLKG
jgi:zinc and cadmium transporter